MQRNKTRAIQRRRFKINRRISNNKGISPSAIEKETFQFYCIFHQSFKQKERETQPQKINRDTQEKFGVPKEYYSKYQVRTC